jgi:hypothetical protein
LQALDIAHAHCLEASSLVEPQKEDPAVRVGQRGQISMKVPWRASFGGLDFKVIELATIAAQLSKDLGELGGGRDADANRLPRIGKVDDLSDCASSRASGQGYVSAFTRS